MEDSQMSDFIDLCDKRYVTSKAEDAKWAAFNGVSVTDIKNVKWIFGLDLDFSELKN